MSTELDEVVAEYLLAKAAYASAWDTHNSARIVYEEATKRLTASKEAANVFVDREKGSESLMHRLADGRSLVIRRRDGWEEPTIEIYNSDGSLDRNL